MKTLKEFDYDLWATEENGQKRYFARVKATHEETEISLEVMRLLLSQEKQMRREYEKHRNFFCPTLIVAPITSRCAKKPNQPTHYYAEHINGLDSPGMVLLEQIKTIDKRRVRKYLGKMSRSQMDEIGEAIETSLGLYVPEEMEAP